MISVFSGFRSAPMFNVGCVEGLQRGQNQFSCRACRRSSAPMSVSGPRNWKFWIRCILLCSSSSESSVPIQERVRAACCVAMHNRAAAATILTAELQSRRPSTSPCSAPRSLGIGWTPSCSTQDWARCVQPAAAACFGRRDPAEFRTTPHSMSPKPFLSSTLMRASGVSSVPDAHSSKMS